MYPYTQNIGNLVSLIKAIGSHGIPDKFTTKELPVWGFKSSNDRTIVGVLRFIGFIDGSGVPQKLWRDARTEAPRAVAEGVRSSYSDLFKMFPNAEQKDAETLNNFFKARTTVGDAAVKQMVATFKALAQFGDFESVSAPQTHTEPTHQAPAAGAVQVSRGQSAGGMTINLNIELVIPSDASGDVYDKFFEAMKRHILD